MVQERITDTDSSDSSSNCCSVNIPGHFGIDPQNRNSGTNISVSVNSIILNCEDSSRNSSESSPSTPHSNSHSPCSRASPLIAMSESDSSHSNDHLTIAHSDEDIKVPLNHPAMNSTIINNVRNKTHRNKAKSNYEIIIPANSSSNSNGNNNETSVKNLGGSISGNGRKLTEPQVENVPPTGIVVPRTVPCIVLTPPALFSPATGVPLFSVDHMQGGKIPASDFTSASARCAAAAAAAAVSFSPFQLNHLVDRNIQNNICHDGIKFKIENSLNLSQSCSNSNNNNTSSINKEDGRSGEGTDSPKKLAFGIDRILAGENEKETAGFSDMCTEPRIPIGSLGHPMEIDFNLNLKNYHTQQVHHHHHHTPSNNGASNEDERSTGGNYPSQCSECFFLSRYCRRIQFPTTTPTSASTSFTWIPSPSSAVHPDSSPSSLLSSTGFSHHQHVSLPSYGMTSTNFSNLPTMVSCNTSGNGRRKRSWSRAVFSNLQRKGLEKRFQLQKYITKPDRRQLAATLGLTDAQVKVWFQNRRMKWRHSKEGKQGTHIPEEAVIVNADKK